MSLNKRGISGVIATVLIILITIVSVVILSSFIIPFVRDNLEGSTDCLDYNTYFEFQERFEVGGEVLRYNCQEGDNYGAFVKTNAAFSDITEEVGGFALVFAGEGESERVEVKPGSTEVRMRDGSSVAVPQPGEALIYVYDGAGKQYNEIEIYPILKSDKICELNDAISIIPCAGVTLSP